MPYSPVELRHLSPKRSLLGYARAEIDRILEDVADSFEQVWRERGELSDKVDELQARIGELRQRETLLTQTLITAEKVATEAKEAARKEAELVVAEAHQEARTVMHAAQAERERLFAEARRVEALLRTALGVVGETQRPPVAADDAGPAPEEAAASPESAAAPAAASVPEGDAPVAPPPVQEGAWPERVGDTREFEIVRPDDQARGEVVQIPPVSLPPVQDEDEESPALREFSWGD